MQEFRDIGEPLALGIEDAARVLGLSTRGTATLVTTGALRSFLVGRRRLVSLNALREFVARREQESAAGADEEAGAEAPSPEELEEVVGSVTLTHGRPIGEFLAGLRGAS